MSEPVSGRLRLRPGPPVAWFAVFVGSFVAAAVVAPFAMSAITAAVPDHPWGFSRIYNRTAMAAAMVFLIIFRRHCGWPELRRLLRRGSRSRRAAEVGVGMAAAIVSIVACVAWALATDRLGPTLNEYHFFSSRTASTLVGGLVAAFIEESFFRGLMLASLTASLGFRAAALASSIAYSAVHLLSSDRGFVWEGFSAGAGFAYLGHALGRHVEPAAVPPLLGLFLGGLVLAIVVRTTGSLYLAIGIHAGWILCFQVLRHATRVLVEVSGTSPLATRHFLVGTGWAWVAIAASAVLSVAWARFARRDVS